MERPTCAAFVAASLDGFIARRDGGLDWLEAFAASGEDHGYRALFEAIDTVLLGRATWEVACRFHEWPYAGKRVAVLSRKPAVAAHGELFLSGDAAAALDRLGAAGARRVYADGGSVDELTVSIVPVVLGDGIRLFQAPLPERPLELVSVRPFPSGLVQLRYRPRPG